MKNSTLTVTFDSEKLDALTYHLNKKDVALKDELSETIQKLYEKNVPQNTRDYLEDKLNRDNVAKPKSRN